MRERRTDTKKREDNQLHGSTEDNMKQKQKDYQRKLLYIFATLTLLNLIAGTLFVLKFYFQDPLPPYILSNEFVTWNLDTKSYFARDAANGAKPTLIKGSEVNRWYAMKHWNVEYLKKKITELHHVYNNTNRWFGPYYDPNKPLTPLVARRNPYKTNVTMKATDFFEQIKAKDNHGYFLYYTGSIQSIGQLGDVQPIQEQISLNPADNSISVCFGETGLIEHMHYDTYHNFYTQIKGRKKFTIFAPSEWVHLYPYPYLHPHHAQTQVNISNTNDTDKFPFITKATGIEITLDPGDLLYLPPLWFRHTETLDTSISVNIRTATEQKEIAQNIFSKDIPVWEENTRTKCIGTVLLIDGIFTRVCNRKRCLGLVEEGLWNMYNTSYQVVVKRKSTYQLFKLYKIRYMLTQKILEYSIQDNNIWSDEYSGLLCEGGDLYEDLVRSVLSEMYGERNKAQFSVYLQNVANFVAKLPDATWELWLGNYIEHLALKAVPAEMLGNFFKHSFSCLEIAFVNNLL